MRSFLIHDLMKQRSELPTFLDIGSLVQPVRPENDVLAYYGLRRGVVGLRVEPAMGFDELVLDAFTE